MAASRCRDSRSARVPRNCPPSKIGMETDGPTANAADVGENRLLKVQAFHAGGAVQRHVRVEVRHRDARLRRGFMQSRLGLAHVRAAAYDAFRASPPEPCAARAALALERCNSASSARGSIAQQQSDGVDELRLLGAQRRQGCGDGGLLSPGLRQVERRGDSVAETRGSQAPHSLRRGGDCVFAIARRFCVPRNCM